MLKTTEIPYDDKQTWELLQEGTSLGVFQLESQLCRMWLRKIKPRNLWELSAVIAGVRPGSLDSGEMDNYVKNKDNPEDMKIIENPVIRDILSETNSVVIFQEQLVQLGMRLAWPHLPELERLVKSDDLRKAVGKKDQAKIMKIGQEFVDGCLHNKVDKAMADKLFDIIKAAGRYSFNMAHAVSYAQIAYITAYLKTHYPLQFYCTYLNHADKKMDMDEEINDLAQEARIKGYKILPPNINAKNLDFKIEGPNTIRYGLSFVKFVANSLNDTIKTLPTITTWQQLLQILLTDPVKKDDEQLSLNSDKEELVSVDKFRSNALSSLISVGAFSDLNVDPKNLLDLVKFIDCIKSKKERKFLREKIPGLKDIVEMPDLIQEMATTVSTKKRQQIVSSEASILANTLKIKSNPLWIEINEIASLYTLLSPGVTKKFEKYASHSCLACHSLVDSEQHMTLVGCIDDVEERIVKNGKSAGKKMAIVSWHDTTGSLNRVVVFSDCLSSIGHLLNKGTIISASVSYSAEKQSFMMNGCSELG